MQIRQEEEGNREEEEKEEGGMVLVETTTATILSSYLHTFLLFSLYIYTDDDFSYFTFLEVDLQE